MIYVPLTRYRLIYEIHFLLCFVFFLVCQFASVIVEPLEWFLGGRLLYCRAGLPFDLLSSPVLMLDVALPLPCPSLPDRFLEWTCANC